ncbi:MAG TPA: hypothetical protein VJG90_02465 [Candidatus Nanoarchaeia archaeon]|nr:hypothetical protein [Candidatus Nanoarchaeia archaeon]
MSLAHRPLHSGKEKTSFPSGIVNGKGPFTIRESLKMPSSYPQIHSGRDTDAGNNP